MLVLATHIFAPDSQLKSLVSFCHACIDMNEQPVPAFLSSTSTNVGLGQSARWFKELTTQLFLCVFRQVSSHTDIRSIFHLLGEQNEFFHRFELLFALLDEQPSPVPFDWSLVMYSDRCYRSIMPLIEQLIKRDRFDLVDEIVNCVDIEIDITLFERFKCSFDDYRHDSDSDDKELNDAFENMCQGHQDVLKRLKKPLLYSDFLLSTRSNSSKLVRLVLLIFANQAQQLPELYDYASIQTEQQKQQPILDKLWTTLVDFTNAYRNRPIVNKIFDYMVSMFSSSVLDQLALGKLIPEDFDSYLRVFEMDAEEEPVEDEKQASIVPENEFQAALLKNVVLSNKGTSNNDAMTRATSSGSASARRPPSRASSSSHLPTFGPASSRRSSSPFTGSGISNIHHLSDKELRSCVTIIEDALLYRSSPELAVQLATKFRMSSYNLIVFSYAHRLYLNVLPPSDIRTRLEQLPATNPADQMNKKRLTNVLRSMSVATNHDDQSNTIEDQKQKQIDRLLSRTSNDDRLISLVNTLLKMSRLFRVDSSRLLNSNAHNDEWSLLKRLLCYPASSFPTKIKLAENLSKQLQISNQQLVELIVDETDKTLERCQRSEPDDDYHCWPFDPNNLNSYKQFISLLYEKNYDAIGKQLIERSKAYEDQFVALNQQGKVDM